MTGKYEEKEQTKEEKGIGAWIERNDLTDHRSAMVSGNSQIYYGCMWIVIGSEIVMKVIR